MQCNVMLYYAMLRHALPCCADFCFHSVKSCDAMVTWSMLCHALLCCAPLCHMMLWYVCRYVCMYVCNYACMYICTPKYVYLCTYVCVCVRVGMLTCVCVYVGSHVCLFMPLQLTRQLPSTPSCMFSSVCMHMYLCYYTRACSTGSYGRNISELASKHS